ncbi:MAG TPA: hypothetical protein VEZ11_09545, partial [Thermoanaerobaculia bacterium]|nr:hypothetical protein [Thermoanaerobaculia bacterium]
MNNWKIWTAAGLIIIGLFAIYTFAAPEPAPPAPPVRTARTAVRTSTTTAGPSSANAKPAAAQAKLVPPPGGIEPIHLAWLDGQTGTYRSDRNLFTYREPPPPPPPPPIKVVPQPP